MQGNLENRTLGTLKVIHFLKSKDGYTCLDLNMAGPDKDKLFEQVFYKAAETPQDQVLAGAPPDDWQKFLTGRNVGNTSAQFPCKRGCVLWVIREEQE